MDPITGIGRTNSILKEPFAWGASGLHNELLISPSPAEATQTNKGPNKQVIDQKPVENEDMIDVPGRTDFNRYLHALWITSGLILLDPLSSILIFFFNREQCTPFPRNEAQPTEGCW